MKTLIGILFVVALLAQVGNAQIENANVEIKVGKVIPNCDAINAGYEGQCVKWENGTFDIVQITPTPPENTTPQDFTTTQGCVYDRGDPCVCTTQEAHENCVAWAYNNTKPNTTPQDCPDFSRFVNQKFTISGVVNQFPQPLNMTVIIDVEKFIHQGEDYEEKYGITGITPACRQCCPPDTTPYDEKVTLGVLLAGLLAGYFVGMFAEQLSTRSKP